MLGWVGIVLVLVGGGMLTVPRATAGMLGFLGWRRRPGPYDRVAAWGLVLLGLVVLLLGRVVR